MEPVPPAVEQWRALAVKYAALSGGIGAGNEQLPPILLPEEILSVIWNESTGNPNAMNPGDPSWGLMGVEQWCAEKYAGAILAKDISVPETNVMAGSRFLAYLKKRYSKTYPITDPALSWICSYNEGEPNMWKKIPDIKYATAYIEHLQAFGVTPQ